MIPKLVISQNKFIALFISDISKEEFDKILNDVCHSNLSEIIRFKPFKTNEVLIPNKPINLYLAMGTSMYWSTINLLEINLFYVLVNRPISSYFNDLEYNIIDFNGTTLKNIILSYVDSWKLSNLK